MSPHCPRTSPFVSPCCVGQEEELGSHFQPLISFVRTTEADVHAIALSSGRGGGAGAGAGASGTSGGGARATESKLPEGIVPRVDHAVAVSGISGCTCAAGSGGMRGAGSAGRPLVGIWCGREWLAPSRGAAGHSGSRFHSDVEAGHGCHQLQVPCARYHSMPSLCCGARCSDVLGCLWRLRLHDSLLCEPPSGKRAACRGTSPTPGTPWRS